MKVNFLIAIVFGLILHTYSESGFGAVIFINPEGGTSEQCTGLTNADYSGVGENQPCALSHPFDVLPPGGPAFISGGDTVLIAPGEYIMGFVEVDPPTETDGNICNFHYPWDCRTTSIPSGTADNPTRILGLRDESGQCTNPPKLIGVERTVIFSLFDSHHVELDCLELTDDSDCGYNHPDKSCNWRDPPLGEYADSGIEMYDSSNIMLRELFIHGFSVQGIKGGRIEDLSLIDVRIVGNALAGIDLGKGIDNGDTSSNSGTLLFERTEIAHNGCLETLAAEPVNCFAQGKNGYGDGLATASTAGHWIFVDSIIAYNSSDGLDLLYGNSDIRVDVYSSRFISNAGNQLKSRGNTYIENSLIVGECGYFANGDHPHMEGVFEGESFSDHCRAAGNALSVHFHPGTSVQVVNSTITGEGNYLIEAECQDDVDCVGTESLRIENSLLLGSPEYREPQNNTGFLYPAGLPDFEPVIENNLVYNVRHEECPGGSNLCVDPMVQNPDIENFDGRLLENSPAIDAAEASLAPSVDINGNSRAAGSGPDIGAYEYNSGVSEPVTVTFGNSAECTMFSYGFNSQTRGRQGDHHRGGDAESRWYSLIRFDIDTTRWSEVVNATLKLHNISGGYVYSPSVVYYRRILDPDNLGQWVVSPVAEGDSFNLGASKHLRSDPSVPWRLLDGMTWDDHFSGILAPLEVSASYNPLNSQPEGMVVELDVTQDMMAWLAGGPNQGWATYHENPDANIQNNTGTCQHPDPALRPVLEVTYIPAPSYPVQDTCNGLEVSVNLALSEVPTSVNDVILGTQGDDTISAMGGNDVICSQGGADVIYAGSGEDWVDAGEGNDKVLGGGDDDTIYGGPGNDSLFGGIGDDSLFGEEDDDSLYGNSGSDTIDGGDGVDEIRGGAGADDISTGAGSTVGSGVFVDGGAGDDIITGGPDADVLRGSSDDDSILGGGGNDRLFGGGGEDEIDGEGGDDFIRGNAANDVLSGGAGSDDIDGGASNDVILGGTGNDNLKGSTGNDDIGGEAGDDLISGGGGNDNLFGGSGVDVIAGGGSNDFLDGGDDAPDSCDGESGSDAALASCEVIVNVP